MLTPAAVVSLLAAVMAASAAPVEAQGPTQSSHALLIDKIAEFAQRELLSSSPGDLAAPALNKDRRKLRREALRALQQGVIEISPPSGTTASAGGGVETADFKTKLLAESASLDAYVRSISMYLTFSPHLLTSPGRVRGKPGVRRR